jgi:hypothetical protein
MGGQNKIPNYFDTNGTQKQFNRPASPISRRYGQGNGFSMSNGLNLMPRKNQAVPPSLNDPLKPNMGFGPSRPVNRFNDTTGIIRNMIQKSPMPGLNSESPHLGYVQAPNGRDLEFQGFDDQRRNFEFIDQDKLTNNAKYAEPSNHVVYNM